MWGALVSGLLLVMPRREPGAVANARAPEESSGRGEVRGRGEPVTRFRLHHPLALPALAINVILFFVQFPLPQGRIADGGFRGLASVADATLIGLYETSFRRVNWTDSMTRYALRDIAEMRAKMKAEGQRELLVVWSRDGAPEWRKIAFYQPDLKVVVLEESGDPAVLSTRAMLWMGKNIQRQIRGEPPLRIDVPPGSRLVWLLAGGREKELAQVAPIRKATNVYYTDVPERGTSFQWGPFEFVAPPVSAWRDAPGHSAQQDAVQPLPANLTGEPARAPDSPARVAQR